MGLLRIITIINTTMGPLTSHYILTATWHIKPKNWEGGGAFVVLDLIWDFYNVTEFPVKKKENSQHLKGIILVLTTQKHSGKPIILDL